MEKGSNVYLRSTPLDLWCWFLAEVTNWFIFRTNQLLLLQCLHAIDWSAFPANFLCINELINFQMIKIIDEDWNNHDLNAYGGFSFCLTSCVINFLKNRTKYCSWRQATIFTTRLYHLPCGNNINHFTATHPTVAIPSATWQ